MSKLSCPGCIFDHVPDVRLAPFYEAGEREAKEPDQRKREDSEETFPRRTSEIRGLQNTCSVTSSTITVTFPIRGHF